MSRLPASVAAGNPVTADVGAEILRQGGSAGDAAAAMVLTACVAETVFTGLAGGGFATYVDAATSSVYCLDFFVTIPGLAGRHTDRVLEEVPIDFGGQIVPYAVGAASVAVPGLPAGVAALHERWGRLPWQEVVEPAIRHAEQGVSFSPPQATVLATVAVAMLRGHGRSAYERAGEVLGGGATLHHPGLADALQMLADVGPSAFYTGPIGEQIVSAIGTEGDLTEADLRAYAVRESAPRTGHLAGRPVFARGNDLDDILGTVSDLQLTDDPVEMARRLVAALRNNPRPGDTTSQAVVDAEGNACAVTTSLGLASGVWLPDYGIHLNSMLGESELLRGENEPGTRMNSMMTPLAMFDDDGLVLVGGAAGSSRIRSALVQMLVHVVNDGMPVDEAIAAPRLNPVPGRVHLEPGFGDEVRAALAEHDEVVQWPGLDAYFGGVAAIDRSGPGADPRRGGDTRRT